MSIDYIWMFVISELISVPSLDLRRTIFVEETFLDKHACGFLKFLFTGYDSIDWVRKTACRVPYNLVTVLNLLSRYVTTNECTTNTYIYNCTGTEPYAAS